jgi:hypothetical protein
VLHDIVNLLLLLLLLRLFHCSVVQLTKRYEAAVRVCQWNSGTHSRPRNVGNILEKEKEIQAQLKAEGALAA